MLSAGAPCGSHKGEFSCLQPATERSPQDHSPGETGERKPKTLVVTLIFPTTTTTIPNPKSGRVACALRYIRSHKKGDTVQVIMGRSSQNPWCTCELGSSRYVKARAKVVC